MGGLSSHESRAGQPRKSARRKPGAPSRQLLLNPRAEGAFEDARGLLFGKFFKGRIDHGFHRPLAQDLRAKRMDGSDGGFFQMLERVFDIEARSAGCRLVSRARSSSWRSRSFSSPAALLVNVTATMWSMVVAPLARTLTMRATSSVVLPVPAEASTNRLSASEVRMRSRAARSSSADATAGVMADCGS